MRQAITTKYIGPTNTRGSRVKATAEAGSITLGWRDECNVDDNHKLAAFELAKRLGWSGTWHGGGLPGAGYVFTIETGDAWDRFEIRDVRHI